MNPFERSQIAGFKSAIRTYGQKLIYDGTEFDAIVSRQGPKESETRFTPSDDHDAEITALASSFPGGLPNARDYFTDASGNTYSLMDPVSLPGEPLATWTAKVVSA